MNRLFPFDYSSGKGVFDFDRLIERPASSLDSSSDFDPNAIFTDATALAAQELFPAAGLRSFESPSHAAGGTGGRRVKFQDGIEEPPRLAEGIADRKQARRVQLQQERHQTLAAAFERVSSENWGDVETRLAQILIAVALGLNEWPQVGNLLKWRPFQAEVCAEWLNESLVELHRQLGLELESFLVMTQQAKVRGASWNWNPERQGPWVELLRAWEGLDDCIEAVLDMARQLDQKRAEAGQADALPSLAEGALLILAQQRASIGLTTSLGVCMQHADLMNRRTPHPLLAQTVLEGQRAAVSEELDGWSEFFLDLLRGDPDSQERVICLLDHNIRILSRQEAQARGVAQEGAQLAALTGAHRADPSLVQAAIAATVSHPLIRDVPLEDLAQRFWETMEALDDQGLLSQAMEELAAEEPRLLAKIGRTCFVQPSTVPPGLTARLAQTLSDAIVRQQLTRVELSPLHPAQRDWLKRGFEALAAATRQQPLILASLLQFLHRHQRELESLADRPLSGEKALDLVLELHAMARAPLGLIAAASEQENQELSRLVQEWMVRWPQHPPSNVEEISARALRRASWILRIEQEESRALPQEDLEARLGRLESSGPLALAERATLYSYAIHRLRGSCRPRRLTAALQAAVSLIQNSPPPPFQILFEGGDAPSLDGQTEVESLRTLIQRSLLEMCTKRQTDLWAQRAQSAPEAQNLQFCIDILQVAQGVCSFAMPLALRLRVDRLMRIPELARRVRPAAMDD